MLTTCAYAPNTVSQAVRPPSGQYESMSRRSESLEVSSSLASVLSLGVFMN